MGKRGRLEKTWEDWGKPGEIVTASGQSARELGGIFLRENLKVTKIKTVAAVRNTFFSSRKSRG